MEKTDEYEDVIIYSLRQAVVNAIDLSIKYNKDYTVVKTMKGYLVIGATYAKHNAEKLQIEYTTNIKQ